MKHEVQQIPLLEEFREALQQRKYKISTIKGYIENVGHFLKWLKEYGSMDIEEINYNDLLNYIQYEQQKELSVSTINIRLRSISWYFEFLKSQAHILNNPARTLRIRGAAKTITENPLTYEELENLYHSYAALQKTSNHQKQTDLSHRRNIVITGLLIWQGLHSGELARLQVEHIDVREAAIDIPSTSRSNSRILKLHASQILTIYDYLHGGTRDQLKPKGEELFAGNMHAISRFLLKELQGINPGIKNLLHIRASVILYWLKLYNKRQVQYMAGHRYIDSTEKYAMQEMDTLTDQLTKHHPFG